MSHHVRRFTALSIAAAFLAGCNHEEGPERRGPSSEAGESARYTAPVGTDSAQPGALHSVVRELVEGMRGPGDRPFAVALRSSAPEAGYARRFGTITRSIVLRVRSPGLTQYPCGACHQGRNVVMGERRIADAHQNIQPNHPQRAAALCQTCHLPENVALFAVRGGPSASLDESQRLCGQCHFAQADAWAGGGHGKRLDGWQGQRVVLACTDCHDPHAPAADHRVPFRAPELQRVRRPVP